MSNSANSSPELDIWCIGLTLLSLLTGRQYPIGTSHKYLDVMAQSAAECLEELRHISHCSLSCSRSSITTDTDVERMQLESDWQIVLDGVAGFLHMDGNIRMRAFKNYKLDDCIKQHVAAHKHRVRNQRCECPFCGTYAPILMFYYPPVKTVSFEPSPLKYKLPLTFDPMPEDLSVFTGEASVGLRNVRMAPNAKVQSYIKYLLRSTVSEQGTRCFSANLVTCRASSTMSRTGMPSLWCYNV